MTPEALSLLARELAPLLAPLVAQEIARLQAAPQRPRARHRDLLPLFEAIWSKGGDATWTCNELARQGLIEPRSTVQLGRDLRRQFELDVPVGPFWVRRHDREHDGRTWSLERR
jgi:hypothetical protein